LIKWLSSLAGNKKTSTDKLFSKNKLKIIPRSEHGVSRKQIDENALKVLYRLHKAGFHACLVGGAVRDLLLNRVPKDFDVATDATPNQIKSLFRNCRLIGRRFRLAHIHFGRQIIEVATFRGSHDDSHLGHQDDTGRIIRDNVFGTIEEDVWRRDFTVNALYYDIADYSVIDYVGGMEDIAKKRLRLIGDPDARYREDPVRMLRAVRFSAKLGFSIDKSCEKFMFKEGKLLQDIPPARLYEETLKIFHSGHAEESYQSLCHFGMLEYLFPRAGADCGQKNIATKFLQLSMQSTDDRIQKNLPVTPAFLFAALLWPSIQQSTDKGVSDGLPFALALQKAAGRLISEQIAHVSIPRRFTNVMRDIWHLQSRFRYRSGKRAHAVLQHQKFRAAYDFLCLRGQAGEPVNEDCEWWTELQTMTPEQQNKMLANQSGGGGRSRKSKGNTHKPNESH